MAIPLAAEWAEGGAKSWQVPPVPTATGPEDIFSRVLAWPGGTGMALLRRFAGASGCRARFLATKRGYRKWFQVYPTFWHERPQLMRL